LSSRGDWMRVSCSDYSIQRILIQFTNALMHECVDHNHVSWDVRIVRYMYY